MVIPTPKTGSEGPALLDQSEVYQRTVDPSGDDSLAKLVRWIRPRSTVLELGPAIGYLTRYLREKLDCTVDCVEYSAAMADKAAPFARAMWVADLDEIELADRFEAGEYDSIVAADVLEHLKNPWRVLEMCRPLLKPGGQLLLSIPNVGHVGLVAELLDGRFDYRREGLLDRTHLRFFTRHTIEEMLHRTGFRVDAQDAVVLPPENTEFSRTLDELPPVVRAGLLKHPDALVYQFLLAASVVSRSDTRDSTPIADASVRTPFFCTKLYWADADGSFTENHCVVRHLPLGPERQCVVFDLPPDSTPRFLRWDPVDRAGFLHLFAIRMVRRDSDGRAAGVLLDWPNGEAIERSTRLENLEYGRTSIGETFTATSEDPQIVFEVPPEALAARDGCLSVEAELDWPMSPDYLVASATLGPAIVAARNAQHALRRELLGVRAAHERLVAQVKRLGRPRVDILVVCYNSSRWLEGFTASLRQLHYPADRVRLVFIDNGSTDDSLVRIKAAATTLPMQMDFVATGRNLGFTGGYEEAFRHAEGDYYFVVNLDTALAPDVIDKLVEVLENDPTIGIAEARQSPREHPKYYDAVTGETSWCSGACMMIRPAALRRIGGGFERSFFMYVEDVDLSWRMWLHGWKCVYVPDAVVEHFTEDLDPAKTPKMQHYFTMRNGALIRAMYGSMSESLFHYAAMLRLAVLSRNPWWHRRLTFKAIFASLLQLPAAGRGRERRGKLGLHPWVFFNGWLFGRHARDLALTAADGTRHADFTALLPIAKKELAHNLPVEQHVSMNPAVCIGGQSMPAILAYDSAKLRYQLSVPENAVLKGAIAAPPDTWNDNALGRFDIQRGDTTIWQRVLTLEENSDRRWVPFEVPLSPTGQDQTTELTLSFNGIKGLVWGLWGDVRVAHVEPAAADADAVDQLVGLAVSIVIPTHNRAESLPLVLRRLMTQDVGPDRFEVIAVDSASGDRTPQMLEEQVHRYGNMTALRCEKPGAASARNMGLAAAKAPLVVLLDDDILVGPDFIRRIFQAHREHPGRILLGRIVAPWDDSTDPFERYLLQVQDVNIYDFPDNSNVPANYFYTACVAIPRDVLGTTKFDEGFSVYGVEDIEFGFRLLGGDRRMVFLPQLRVLHDYHPDYPSFRRKKHKAGYSLGYFHQRHPEQAQRLTFGARFVRNYSLLRILRTLSAPLAKLALFWERIRYRTGPVNRFLFRWWYVDLRIRLYEGLLRFKRGEPPP